MSYAQGSKQRAILAFDIGVDDFSSVMTWKKRWDEYNAAAKAAYEHAQKKGGIVNFVRMAVFGVAAAFTGGMSTIAQAAIGFGASAAGGMIADEILGEYDLVKPTATPTRKYKQSGEIQKIAEFDTAYDTLDTQIEQSEDAINMGHWMQPLQLTMQFYGQELFQELMAGTLLDPASSIDVGLMTGSIEGTAGGATVSDAGSVTFHTAEQAPGSFFDPSTWTPEQEALQKHIEGMGGWGAHDTLEDFGIDPMQTGGIFGQVQGANLDKQVIEQSLMGIQDLQIYTQTAMDLTKPAYEAYVELSDMIPQTPFGDGVGSNLSNPLAERNLWNQGYNDILEEIISDTNLT